MEIRYKMGWKKERKGNMKNKTLKLDFFIVYAKPFKGFAHRSYYIGKYNKWQRMLTITRIR
jgi:hypothetical protein